MYLILSGEHQAAIHTNSGPDPKTSRLLFVPLLVGVTVFYTVFSAFVALPVGYLTLAMVNPGGMAMTAERDMGIQRR